MAGSCRSPPLGVRLSVTPLERGLNSEVDPSLETHHASAPAIARSGPVISIVGPDGAGKTTLIDALSQGILKQWRVKMIRDVGILPRRYVPTGGSVPEPHKDPPYSMPVSIAKTMYLFGDYLAGWIFDVRPFVRNGGCLIIQRGWWDLAVDPRRYRLAGSGRVASLLGRFLPHPELLLILEAPPEVMYARKQQLSLEELKRQIEQWHVVLPRRQRRVFLDSSLGAEQVLQAAEAEIEKLLSSRVRSWAF